MRSHVQLRKVPNEIHTLVSPPPHFSRLLRPGNRPLPLPLPHLASSAADATSLARVGLLAVPAYPISVRDGSLRSPLINPSTPIVCIGVAQGWDAPTRNCDTGTVWAILRQKPGKNEGILSPFSVYDKSNTTNYTQTSVQHKGTRSTYRVNPLRHNGKRCQSTFLYPDLTFTVIPDGTSVHADIGETEWNGVETVGMVPGNVSSVASRVFAQHPETHTYDEPPPPCISARPRPRFDAIANFISNTILRLCLPRGHPPQGCAIPTFPESPVPPVSARRKAHPTFPNQQPPVMCGLNRGYRNGNQASNRRWL